MVYKKYRKYRPQPPIITKCFSCGKLKSTDKLHICKVSELRPTGQCLEIVWSMMGLDFNVRQEIREDLMKLGVDGFE